MRQLKIRQQSHKMLYPSNRDDGLAKKLSFRTVFQGIERDSWQKIG